MPSFISESSKNFLVVFFLPITITTMPFFAIDAWQSVGLELNHTEILFLALGLGSYLLIVNLISLRFSEISQWFFTAIQMIPLLIIPIIALSMPLSPDEIMHKKVGDGALEVETAKGLEGLFPSMVLLTGIPAIMFAFDGFYEASSIRKNMKNPNKNTKAILSALFIILAIYIFVSISFGIGSKEGSIEGIFDRTPSWVKKLFNILISIGVISTINGYILASMSQFEDLNNRNESMILIMFRSFMQKIGFKRKTNRLYAFGYLFTIYVSLTILLWAIGTFVWREGKPSHGKFYVYSFINIITNYNSLIIYLAISGSVVGGLINRKTQRIKVEKSKLFLPSAIISCIFVSIGFTYTIIEGIVDSTGFNDANKLDALIKLIFFLSFILISLFLGLYEKKWLKGYHLKIGHQPEEWEIDLMNQNNHYKNKIKK
ncbi:MAG: amino acid permease [Mycoplasmatales bacterium]|nr:amino acid permease [Mycoplasmatales bacterium]